MIALPLFAPRRPDSRELLPLERYDLCIVSCSGGKDSLAVLLDLLERGVPRQRVQLWHQAVDGQPGVDEPFADWPCTVAYVRAVSEALGVRVLVQYRVGGFLAELLKDQGKTLPVRFERQDGTWGQAGGVLCQPRTRRRFPQKSADLRVRWCTPVLKIDVAALTLTNDPALRQGRFLFLTGERRQESAHRAAYAEREPHRCDSQRRRVDAWRSVIDWDEERVWNALRRHGVVPHPAYRLGFGRVSCLTCIFGGADQWASVRRLAPHTFARIAAYERQFGCTITPGRGVDQLADAGRPYPETADVALVDLALGTEYPGAAVRIDPTRWTLPAGAFKRGGGPA
jgi:3'-phosphoadenosine 5'-phosphosulfate sulfotransferase (PAPS reductase)/FAD synthetase